MTTSGLRLLEGSFVSVQDGGRPGHARHGVGAAGPMDPLTHLLAVRLAGAHGDETVRRTTAIEVGPDGARIGVEDAAVDLSVAGPGATVRLGVEEVRAPAIVRVEPGVEVTVSGARWTTVCPVGDVLVPRVLGSTSRHGRTGLGHDWRVGERVSVETLGDDAGGSRGSVRLGTRPAPPSRAGALLLLPGPQTHLFPTSVRARLGSGEVVVSATGDRMAQRLDGVRLPLEDGHDIVSDATVAGAVQVQGDGAPWVLMAEHQPTGGYPKIAVLAAADRCRLARQSPGTRIALRWGTVDQARLRWHAAVVAVEDCVGARPRPTADVLRRAAIAGDVAGARDDEHGPRD